MLLRVVFCKINVWEECSASTIRVTRIGEQETTLAAISNRHILFPTGVHRLLVIANVVLSSPILFILIIEALLSSEMSVATRFTRRNIPEYVIFIVIAVKT
jgi:hypothetical protein